VLYKKLKNNLNLINISYKDKCRITKLLVERVETNGEGFVKVFGVIPKEVVLQPSQLVGVNTKPLKFYFKVKLVDKNRVKVG